MKTAYTHKNGFTLIELVVVVAIIAILSGIAVAIINPAEYIKQARDSKRVSDIMNVQTALIAALANNDIELVATAGCSDCNSFESPNTVDGEGWVIFNGVSERGLSTFLQSLPVDKTNDETFNYRFYSDGELFELNAVLESDRYQEYAILDGGNNNSIYERGTKLTIN